MPAKVVRKRLMDYLQEFFRDSKSIGMLLIACTIISLVLANLPFGVKYTGLFSAESEFLHQLYLPSSPGHFFNDGLMVVFFFLVGLEIKRELTTGELATLKQALLPVGAAFGGMLVPAFFFILFNRGTEYSNGWGIPMATDIAFSLGVASILGNKFPQKLKVFLTALAIIDDLGAIIVIAFFYGGTISGYWLFGTGVCLAILVLLNTNKRPFGILYVVTGLALWYCVFNSGIHATIAGVLFAFTVPQKDLERLEHFLHKPVNFIVLPLFALANTAIILDASLLKNLGSTLSLGILFGLFFGKPIGILAACRVMVSRKMARLPQGINWFDIAGAGILAGIGFTMSIFISGLAFSAKDMQDISKLTVLLSAVLSIVFILIYTSVISRRQKSRTMPANGPHLPNIG